MAAGESTSLGTVVIGTVEGDLHDIGKNLVAMMLQGAGFEVVNLGTGVTATDFVAAVPRQGPRASLGMSALLTTTLPHMAETMAALKEAGLREGREGHGGGAPVTAAFAAELGADGYGANAGLAVEKAKELVSVRTRPRWLTDAERDAVRDEAFGILERVGMRMQGAAALPLLREAGALVSPDGVVRFPAALVERALAACPRTVLMAGESPDTDAVLDGTRTLFNVSGCAAKTLDAETGRVRPVHAARPARRHRACWTPYPSSMWCGRS